MTELFLLIFTLTCVTAQEFPYYTPQYSQVHHQQPREFVRGVPVYQPPIIPQPYPVIQPNPQELPRPQPALIQNIQYHPPQTPPLETRVRRPQDTQFSSAKGPISNRFNPTTENPTDSLIGDGHGIDIDTKFGDRFDEALEAILAVAIRLEALLTTTNLKNSRNFMVSPLSMAVAVGELMLGAKDPFKTYLHDLVVLKNLNDTYDNSVRHMKDKNADLEYASLHEQLGELMRHLSDEGERAGSGNDAL